MPFNRLDPSQMDPSAIAELSGLVAGTDHVVMQDDAGNAVELPAPLFAFFARMVQAMQERRTVMLMPEDEAFTTQAAANHLGVSRQHLVGLLEGGSIPFHKVGTHRRVYFRDLVEYEKERDGKRRRALNALADAVDEAGLYDASYTGDDEG